MYAWHYSSSEHRWGIQKSVFAKHSKHRLSFVCAFVSDFAACLNILHASKQEKAANSKQEKAANNKQDKAANSKQDKAARAIHRRGHNEVSTGECPTIASV